MSATERQLNARPSRLGSRTWRSILDLPPAEPESIDEPVDSSNSKHLHRNPSPSPPLSPMNPFAAGGWGARSGMAPSIFGALPTTTIANAGTMQRDSVLYKFTSCNTTILNCTIAGPSGRAVYRVVTESGAPSSTMFKDNDGRNVAMMNWQPNANVEIRGIASRQRVRDWLHLSTDQRFGLVLSAPCAYADFASLQPTGHASWRGPVCMVSSGRLHMCKSSADVGVDDALTFTEAVQTSVGGPEGPCQSGESSRHHSRDDARGDTTWFTRGVSRCHRSPHLRSQHRLRCRTSNHYDSLATPSI